MVHRDGSTHKWIPGEQWDLVVTMDDVMSEVYSGILWPGRVCSRVPATHPCAEPS